MRSSFTQARLLAAVVFSLAASPASALEPVGIVTLLEGNAYVGRTDEPKPVPLTPQAPIYSNDVIETQAKSRLRILFQDDHLLTVAENTRIGVNSGRDAHLQLDRGAVRSSVAGTSHPRGSPLEIVTPTAVVVAHDAYFTVWVEEDAPALAIRPQEESESTGDRPVPMPPAVMPPGRTGVANIGTLGQVALTANGETRLVEPGQFVLASPRTPPLPAVQIGATPPFVIAERIRATTVKESPRAEGPKELLRVVGGGEDLRLAPNTTGESAALAQSRLLGGQIQTRQILMTPPFPVGQAQAPFPTATPPPAPAPVPPPVPPPAPHPTPPPTPPPPPHPTPPPPAPPPAPPPTPPPPPPAPPPAPPPTPPPPAPPGGPRSR